MFRTVRLPIIGSLFTVHSAMAYVIQICKQLSSRTRMELMEFHPGPARKLSTNLYGIYHCWVKSRPYGIGVATVPVLTAVVSVPAPARSRACWASM